MTHPIVWARLYLLDERFKSRFVAGNVLSSPAKFDPPTQNSWSVVIEFVRLSDQDDFWWGKVHFLVDQAPHELLFVGNEFAFMDGPRPVLCVVISDPPEENAPLA